MCNLGTEQEKCRKAGKAAASINSCGVFAVTWMDLEIVILSEASQTEKGKYHISFICGI